MSPARIEIQLIESRRRCARDGRSRRVPLTIQGRRFAKNKKDARASAQQVVDLAGMHVAPPFCEAHKHNLGLDFGNERSIYNYLRKECII